MPHPILKVNKSGWRTLSCLSTPRERMLEVDHFIFVEQQRRTLPTIRRKALVLIQGGRTNSKTIISGLLHSYQIEQAAKEFVADYYAQSALADPAGLALFYWDCECEDAYIHPKRVKRCKTCGATSDNQPDSHIREVAEAMREILARPTEVEN